MPVAIARIINWNEERGFGFARLEGAERGADIFVHATSLCPCLRYAGLPMVELVLFGVPSGWKTDVPPGTIVHVVTEDGQRGPRSTATACERCYRSAAYGAVVDLAKERFRALFKDGHRFEIDGVAWFYAPGLKAKNEGILAFEEAAIRAILGGAPDAQVRFEAEEAARSTYR